MPILATLTNNGIVAALAAQTSGLLINVTNFKIGSASGFTPQVTDVAVHTLVYTGLAGQLTYRINNQNTVIFRVLLDYSVGNFTIGNIGLYLADGSLFALCALPAQEFKSVSNYPTVIGNVKIFDISLNIANSGSLINYTITQSLPAQVPELTFDTSLPPANSTPFTVYFIDMLTTFGNRPGLAWSNGTIWQFFPFSASSTLSNLTLVTNSSGSFSVVPLTTIYFAIFKFTNNLTGNLTATITTAGMIANNLCRVISPTSLAGFTFTVNGFSLVAKQYIDFIFTGAVWQEIGSGNLL